MKHRLIHTVVAAMAMMMLGGRGGTTMGQAAAGAERQAEVLAVGDQFIRVAAVSENVVRVTCSKERAALDPVSFAVVAKQTQQHAPGTTVSKNGNQATITCGNVKTSVSLATGKVTFADAKTGKMILAEAGRTLVPVEVQREKTYQCRQTWEAQRSEALYGLGQHQHGLINLKNLDLDLWQRNTEFTVPFLVSSKGYGIYWDSASFTKFGDPGEYVAIPREMVYTNEGLPGGFTATPYSGSKWGEWNMGMPGVPRVEVAIAGGRPRDDQAETALRWEGEVLAPVEGLYKFRLYASGGTRMWIDGKLVADHWRQGWLPSDDVAIATFKRNTRHKIVVEWIKDGGTHCTMTWKPPVAGEVAGEAPTSLWSQASKAVDYYFIYGGGEKAGALDKVIAGYRQLTGKAPLMPLWAFGLWQSRERYETQQASLDVVKGFRDRKIPFDTIVQDWMYWPEAEWGSHAFDKARFPDAEQWVKQLHAMNARVMISVWGKYYPGTENYEEMNAKGYLYPTYPAKDWVGHGHAYTFYDAFNKDARTMFWEQVNEKLFSKGFDAWWMDATEPDLVQPSPPTVEKLQGGMGRTAAGTAASVMNAYPLMNSKGVYEGQRAAKPDQRVFILTRAGFAGQQRYATAVWSGDISSTWSAMKKQIAAGLGTSMSGLPYWTMDSGGFSVPAKFSGRLTGEVAQEWRELNTRWLQFAAFVPIFRVHGQAPHREMWHFGGEMSDAYKAQKKIDQVRYRMLPFWYSLSADVTQNDGTFMRPLVMDYPEDEAAREVADQYLLGGGLMVSPVTEYKARTRYVYLPGGGEDVRWYDFWTGAMVQSAGTTQPATVTAAGGLRIEVPAPYDHIPLHVRAGTILPTGPELQYTMEKKADLLTVYVYTGADGRFSLYEDDGLTNQYEKGAFSRIAMTWNEGSRTLTIGRRQGSFAGMLAERTIRVVFVMPEKAVGFAFEPKVDRVVHYDGGEVVIRP